MSITKGLARSATTAAVCALLLAWGAALAAATTTEGATPQPFKKDAYLIPSPLGTEGLGPHIQRDVAEGSAAAIERALDRMRFCKFIQQRSELPLRSHPLDAADAETSPVWLVSVERACQTVTPELLAQRRALAAQLVASKRPGAVRRYEETFDLGSGADFDASTQLQLASWHREAALRGDDFSVQALAELGRRYGLQRTELRAWGHFAKRCFPAGLRGFALSDHFEPFLFREERLARLQAAGNRDLFVPTVDAKLDADARTLAASWPCPPPAN